MYVRDGSVKWLSGEAMLQMALTDKAYVTLFEDWLVCIKLSPYSLICLI